MTRPIDPRIALLLAVLSCARPERDAGRDSAVAMGNTASAAAGTTVRPPGTTGAVTSPRATPEILIDSVIVGNPLVVAGRARTFENTVQLRARDARGAIISETFTTSAGETGHHNPYRAQLWIVRDPGTRVTAEAFEYSADDGSVRSLTRSDVPYPVPRRSITLRFPVGDDCTTTAPFTRAAPHAPAVARLHAEALVAGPDSAERAAGALAVFPAGSIVRSVVLRDGVLVVDFNERLQNVGGSCAATAIRASVTRTLGRLPGVRRVVISAGGSEALALQP